MNRVGGLYSCGGVRGGEMFAYEGGVELVTSAEQEAGSEERVTRGWFRPKAWGYAVGGEGGVVPWGLSVDLCGSDI